MDSDATVTTSPRICVPVLAIKAKGKQVPFRVEGDARRTAPWTPRGRTMNRVRTRSGDSEAMMTVWTAGAPGSWADVVFSLRSVPFRFRVEGKILITKTITVL